MTGRTIVEAQQISRRYGSGDTAVLALRQVSLALRRGDRIAVTGPSGSGKSTLLSVLGLIDRPDAGRILVEGQPTENLSEDQLADLRRQKIGLVFQAFHLIPALSATENVIAPLIPYGPDGQTVSRARQLLDMVGLGARHAHRPGELSGGEQQRVAIARALINMPSLVLADEPSGNLDSQTAAQVMDALDELQHRYHFGLVAATHDAMIAARMDRKVELRDGAVISTHQDATESTSSVDGVLTWQ